LNAIARIIATWFGCGYAPKGPGTAGSLAAIIIAWLLHAYAGFAGIWFAWLCIPLLPLAIWAADAVARQSGAPGTKAGEDPQIVVVDEVVGQWITLAGAITMNWKSWLAAFLLFRAFDIWKPPPVRQLERLPGGLGIVADDVGAGIYAALVLFAAGWFNLY